MAPAETISAANTTGTATAAGRLLQTIFEGGAMSRARATALTGLSRSAVGVAAEDLGRIGLVEATSSRPADRPGRPSVTLSARGHGATVIAGELRPDWLRIARFSLGGALTDLVEEPIDVAEVSPEATLDRISDAFESHIAGVTEGMCAGAALSVPGLVRRATGVVTLSLPLGWSQVPVVDLLRQRMRTRMPLHVGQDALFAAIAERTLGAGTGAARMLLLMSARVGVGGAIVGAGRDAVGADHSLQAGHVIVEPDGMPCICGAHGCLEMYADGREIGAALGLDRPADRADLTVAIDSGLSSELRATLADRVIRPLSVGLVSLVNTLGPDRVILGGVLGVLHREFGSELSEALASSVVAIADGASVHASLLEESVLAGAGCAAFTELFTDPVGLHRQMR